MTKAKDKSEKKQTKSKGSMVALRDYEFQYGNNVQVFIKEGDDVSKLDLPDWVITNLKTVKVLKG